jgi:Ca-activated chloride channel family protein
MLPVTWADPRWLWGIPASVVLAMAVDVAARKAKASVRRLDPAFRGRSRARAILPATAAALLCAALARPQWGLRPSPSPTAESDVVLLVDTSGSMLVRDVAPDRFTRTRLFARDLLRRLPEGVRVAVVRVEGEGEVVCPLTLDRAAAEDALEELVPRGASAPGSDLGNGVRTSLSLLAARPSRAKSIGLLSDGEDLDAGLKSAAEECRRRGVVLDAAVAGTASGGPVPARDGGVLVDGGSPVVSHSRPELMEPAVRATGGRILSLASSAAAADALAAGLRDSSRPGGRQPVREPISRSAWPVAGAIGAWALWRLPPGREQ